MVEKAEAVSKNFPFLPSGQGFVSPVSNSVPAYHLKTTSWSSISILHGLTYGLTLALSFQSCADQNVAWKLCILMILLTFISQVGLYLHLYPVHPGHMNHLCLPC